MTSTFRNLTTDYCEDLPLVSVVIPCFNAADTIRQTLNSVMMQQYKNMEVLVIDDGSTDDTFVTVQQVINYDPRFTVFTQENKGVSAARNKGIQEARGDHIAFLDADDLFFRDALSKRMNVFQEEDDPDLIGVYCPAVLIDKKGGILFDYPVFNYSLPNGRLYFTYSPECSFTPSCVIIKKKLLLETGGFDENLSHAEDYELWHRLMRKGGFFRKIDTVFVGWTQHKMSASHYQRERHFKCCKTVSAIIFGPEKCAIPELLDGMGRASQLLSRSKRALSSSIMAFFLGQEKEACRYFSDIQKIFIEQIHYCELYGMIKSIILRCRCLREADWSAKIYPAFKCEIDRFFDLLDVALGGNIYSIRLARQLLWGSLDDELHCKIGADRFPIIIPGYSKTQSYSPMFEMSAQSPIFPVSVQTCSYSQAFIELLDLSLLEENRRQVEYIYALAEEFHVPLGWHYILDIIWILNNIHQLNSSAIILDAGAGQGILQYILAKRGFKVASVDFLPRTPPPFWKTVSVADKTSFDHAYLKFMIEECYGGFFKTLNDRIRVHREKMKTLLKSGDETIIFYRSDLKQLRFLDDASVDCVVSVSALEHNEISDARSTILECERVLKCGGNMVVTVSASLQDDWFHEQSKGWCWSERRLQSIFGLRPETRSNFCDKEAIFDRIRQEQNELHRKLASIYFRSGNNGMPWGKWIPKYLPVGIFKMKDNS